MTILETKAAMAAHLIGQYQNRVAGKREITPEDIIQEADRVYDMGRKHRAEELQPLIDGLSDALKAIDRLSCNAPLMSHEVQAHFGRNQAPDAYRVELNALILSMRAKARIALANLPNPTITP